MIIKSKNPPKRAYLALVHVWKRTKTRCSRSTREQPIFSTRAHVFQIDPTTKRNWIPASKHAVSVSFFYDANRNVYRIISVGGTKVRGPLRRSCRAHLEREGSVVE